MLPFFRPQNPTQTDYDYYRETQASSKKFPEKPGRQAL